MYISPNFEIEKSEKSHIITPHLRSDGTIEEFMFADNLGINSTPEIKSGEINRDRIVLAEIGKMQTMYLYSDGKIKTERNK